jgi:hypothetical protein
LQELINFEAYSSRQGRDGPLMLFMLLLPSSVDNISISFGRYQANTGIYPYLIYFRVIFYFKVKT